MKPGLRIVKPGLLTTVQDLGRWGLQTEGVPPAGPMDPYSHRVANALVGNREDAATLEITLIGPDIEIERAATIAVAGAAWRCALDDVPVECHCAIEAPAGSRLRFLERLGGARAYLAVDGGIDVPPVFGSRATHLLSRMGGLEGRALGSGDWVALGPPAPRTARPRPAPPPLVLPDRGARVRVMLGPQDDLFDPETLDLLVASRYEVSAASNRMAFRLAGPVLASPHAADVISEPTALGSLQVPASGQPILLMADRQTAGGYPKIATLISADVPIAGQLAPGDWIEFAPCSRREAVEALLALERPFLAHD